jgi:hypothetical protein
MKIESTSENKKRQKTSVFYSSSTVFLVNHNPNIGVTTEVSLLNHFLIKRGIVNVRATVYLREINGDLVDSRTIILSESKTYTIDPCVNINRPFLGSVYIEFESDENLAIPFCAVVVAIKSEGSVCAVHTYGRRLEAQEIGGKMDLPETKETGWTLRDSDLVTSFAAFHSGREASEMKFEIEVKNSFGSVISSKFRQVVNAYETVLLQPKELFPGLVTFLSGDLGHAKVKIKGLKGVFPRMLCGNFAGKDSDDVDLNRAREMQFTHTNFDFGYMEQSDSIGNRGYFNQPDLPGGYGIVYPVATSKKILVGGEKYHSDQIFKFNSNGFDQTNVECINSNLPTRFVTASVGIWPNGKVESECSTGTYVEDYLAYPCHWHWGLLKPGFSDGESVISIILNKFDNKKLSDRNLKLRIFDESGLIKEKSILLRKSLLLNDINVSATKGSVWFVLNGERLEDLNIFATHYPANRVGFCEHAF